MRTSANILVATCLFVAGLVFSSAAIRAQEQDMIVGVGFQFEVWTGKNADPQPDGPEIIGWVSVNGLVCDGPAMMAGVERGDVIRAINGAALFGLTGGEFSALLEEHIKNRESGEIVTLTLERYDPATETPAAFDLEVILAPFSPVFDC